MSTSGSRSGDRPAQDPSSRALARREAAAVERPPQRTMLVDANPAQVVELLRSRSDVAERRLEEEKPLTFTYHHGRIFIDASSERVVLWRRPSRPRFRGAWERIPYPDMLELRLKPTPQGTSVEMRMKVHPQTTGVRRLYLVVLLPLLIAWVSWAVLMDLQHLWLVLLCFGPFLVEPIRHARARRRGRRLVPWAYSVLAPHELSPRELEGSAFRARTTRVLPDPGPSPDDRSR